MSMPPQYGGVQAQVAGAEPRFEPAVAPVPVQPFPAGPAPVAPRPVVPLESALLPAPAVATELPVAPALGVPSAQAVTRDRPPDERPARLPGGVGGPVRSAAAMVGALLVGASFALAATGHMTHVPAPAPRVATFHSSDRDMNLFWHSG